MKRKSISAAILATLALAQGARAAGPPEIYTVTPNEGAAGDTVRLKGRRFVGTTQVMVVTAKGMTVTVPPSNRTMRSIERKQAALPFRRQGSLLGCFFLPKENGIWFKPGGGALQVVERGMRVGEAMLVFAKNGAKSTPYHPRVLFYEPEADAPQATVGGRRSKAARSFAVDKIVVSEIDLLRIKLPWE